MQMRYLEAKALVETQKWFVHIHFIHRARKHYTCVECCSILTVTHPMRPDMEFPTSTAMLVFEVSGSSAFWISVFFGLGMVNL